MSLADGSAWEREFGVSEASKAADAALRSDLTGRDPLGVFPRPSTAGDVPGNLPYMPEVIMTPELRAQIDEQSNYLQVVKPKIEIFVYLDDGVVFSYTVDTITSAREHASAIVATGYRSVQEEQPDVLTHFPPHRILKVKVKANGTPFKTNYFDKATGT